MFRYSGDMSLDVQFLVKQSSVTSPVLIMYTTERDAAEKVLYEIARKKQQSHKTVVLSGSGDGEERMARKTIQEAMSEVSHVEWLQCWRREGGL